MVNYAQASIYLGKMSNEMVVENTEKISDKITCESCGKDFSCGANVGKCWCFEVELKAETLAELREDFKSCLCQGCLEKISTNINQQKIL